MQVPSQQWTKDQYSYYRQFIRKWGRFWKSELLEHR